MKKYDIFISYRREGGYETARAIEASLSKRGYSVFLDVEGLRSGEFNKQLYQVIDNCKDVLVICSPHSLDRCKNEGDWVCNEISHAIQKNKSVIPILVNGFQFPEPEELPESIRTFPNYQALTPSPQTFSASLDILCKRYLKSKPVYSMRILTMLACFLLVACSAFGIGQFFRTTQALSESELDAVDQSCAYSLSTIQMKADSCLRGLDRCIQYLDGDLSDQDLAEALELLLSFMDTSKMAEVPAVHVAYAGSDFLESLSAQAEGSAAYRQYLDFARWLLLESNKSVSERRSIVENMEKIVHQDYLNALNRVFGAFLPIENRFERKANGDYRYNAIYAVYHTDKGLMEIAGSVKNSLFANSNDNLRPEQIHEQINGSTDIYISKIESLVGDKWNEMVEMREIK